MMFLVGRGSAPSPNWEVLKEMTAEGAARRYAEKHRIPAGRIIVAELRAPFTVEITEERRLVSSEATPVAEAELDRSFLAREVKSSSLVEPEADCG